MNEKLLNNCCIQISTKEEGIAVAELLSKLSGKSICPEMMKGFESNPIVYSRIIMGFTSVAGHRTEQLSKTNYKFSDISLFLKDLFSEPKVVKVPFGKYEAIVSKETIVVGCQSFLSETVKQIRDTKNNLKKFDIKKVGINVNSFEEKLSAMNLLKSLSGAEIYKESLKEYMYDKQGQSVGNKYGTIAGYPPNDFENNYGFKDIPKLLLDSQKSQGTTINLKTKDGTYPVTVSEEGIKFAEGTVNWSDFSKVEEAFLNLNKN